MSVLDIASSQTSCTVTWSVEPEQPVAIIDHILPYIGFANTACEVNEWVFPMLTAHYFTYAPSIEACNSKWIAWDESLDSPQRLPVLVTDKDLYVRMQEHATRHHFNVVLSTSDNQEMLRTMPMEIHLLSHIETIELLGRIYREFRSLKSELESLKHEVRSMRRIFGANFENLAAHDENLTPLLNLMQPFEEVPMDADGPV
jgi:hypothetical protein